MEALEDALRSELDPSVDPARSTTQLDDGASILFMPSFASRAAGVKVLTINPENARFGIPYIHGIYLLFDRPSLIPRAVLDGTALTTLRTPAMSIAAVRHALRRFHRPWRVVIFGAGPQGIGHLDGLCVQRQIRSGVGRSATSSPCSSQRGLYRSRENETDECRAHVLTSFAFAPDRDEFVAEVTEVYLDGGAAEQPASRMVEEHFEGELAPRAAAWMAAAKSRGFIGSSATGQAKSRAARVDRLATPTQGCTNARTP